MAKRRAKGEGTIFFWEEKNLWVAKITLPTGKRKTKYGKTQKEVIEWLLTARNALRQGVFVEKGNITVSQFLERYLSDYAAHNLRPPTFASYSHNIKNHIIPVIGNVKLTKLRADHLHSLYNQKRDELSPKTVHYLHGIIHRSLNKAVKWGLLNHNPASKAETPTYRKKEMKTWSGSQVKKFLNHIEGDRWWAVYVVACGTAMRQGEILALHWKDIDLEDGYLRVTKTLQYVQGEGLKFLEPKSAKAKRMVSLPQFVVDALNIHKARQDELRKSPEWDEQGLVFTTNIGTPISPRNLVRHFKKKINEVKLPEIRFHDLRHTTATLLLEKNTHPKIVQELLGHSSVNLTLSVYSHALPPMMREAAEKLDDIFK